MHPVAASLPQKLASLTGMDQLRQVVLTVCPNALWDQRPKGDWLVVPPSKASLPQGTKGRNLLTIRPGKKTFGMVILSKSSGCRRGFPRFNSDKVESYEKWLREVLRDIAPGDETTTKPTASRKVTARSQNITSNASRPVRIVPMAPDDSNACSIEEQQNDYFLGALRGKLKGTYYCRSVLIAEPGTPVLFQYRNHVIAFARFVRAETLDKPNKHGYPKIMVFDPASIRVFKPVTADAMRSIWPGEFKKFTHTKPELSHGGLDAFWTHVGVTVEDTHAPAASNPKAAGGWIGSTMTYIKTGSGPTEVSADHNRMQEKLRDQLWEEYGARHVFTEQNRVDIRVTTADEDILFEIKPDESPLSVIRQALGQLLEYAFLHYKPTSGRKLRLVVVGRSPLGKTEKSYLDHLKKTFALPLAYRVVEI